MSEFDRRFLLNKAHRHAADADDARQLAYLSIRAAYRRGFLDAFEAAELLAEATGVHVVEEDVAHLIRAVEALECTDCAWEQVATAGHDTESDEMT